MKRFIAQSQSKSGSFHKEGSNWQDIRNSALGYYGIKYLYYKEDRADDFLIDAMLRLVGSINLSLSPNAAPTLSIKSKELKTVNAGYQMNFDFAPQTSVLAQV
jgi:prenyltransferase beta subunit